MWAISNSLKGWTLYNLSIREMQLVIQSLSSNERKLTLVCKKNDIEWRSLSVENHPEFFEISTQSMIGYPELILSSNSHEDSDYFIVRSKKIIHPRLHERYDINVSCSIISNLKEYVTSTIDLSEGGIHFKDTMPDWVAGYFFVVVEAKNTVFKLMCSVVEDQKERKRVQIVAEESDPHYVAYRNWLAQHETTKS